MPFQSKQKSRNLQPSLHPSCIHPWFLYIDTKFTCFCIWKWPDPARMGWHLVRIAIETILQIPVHRLLTFHHHRSQANTQTDSAWDDDLQKAISTCCNHLGVDQYPSMSPDSMSILSHRDFLSFTHFVQLHGVSSPWATRRGSIEVLSFMDTLLCSLGNPNFHGVVREKLEQKHMGQWGPGIAAVGRPHWGLNFFEPQGTFLHILRHLQTSRFYGGAKQSGNEPLPESGARDVTWSLLLQSRYSISGDQQHAEVELPGYASKHWEYLKGN